MISSARAVRLQLDTDTLSMLDFSVYYGWPTPDYKYTGFPQRVMVTNRCKTSRPVKQEKNQSVLEFEEKWLMRYISRESQLISSDAWNLTWPCYHKHWRENVWSRGVAWQHLYDAKWLPQWTKMWHAVRWSWVKKYQEKRDNSSIHSSIGGTVDLLIRQIMFSPIKACLEKQWLPSSWLSFINPPPPSCLHLPISVL